MTTTQPLLALLGFAGCTLPLLIGTVGWHRRSGILAGHRWIVSFSVKLPEGSGWYLSATPACAN
jgi:hypothetical protein